jgi:hypothetical protein
MVPSRDVRAGGSAYAASRQRVRPLVRFRGAPGTRSRKTRTGMGFHPTGPAFRRPSGFRLPGSTSSREAERRPPLRFRSSSETCPCSPAPQRRGASRSRRPTVPQCSLSWASVPYDTISDRRTRIMATDPSAAACRVRGLDTPCATSTTDPPGARSAGASLGFALQGVPLERERCPFRGPCPPDVARHRQPPREGGRAGRGRLQGLVPATSPCCHPFLTRRSGPSMPSWASPLQSVHPIRPGHRL